MKRTPILTLAVFTAIGATWLSLSTLRAQQESAESRAVTDASPVTEAGFETSAAPIEPDKSLAAGLTAAEVLRGARERLHGYQSVKADLIQTVAIGERSFRATGTYLQGRDLQLRMSLNVQLGDDGRFRGSLLQVCDGQVLWTSHRYGAVAASDDAETRDEGAGRIQEQITRRDVRQILQVAANHKQQPRSLLCAELGLGGLSEMLASLENTMAFGDVKRETIDGKTFLVFQGRWNLEVLTHFLSEEELNKLRTGGDARQLPRLPEHVPDMVRLYFDEKSQFPRRVLYLKRPEAEENLRRMVSLNFVNIVLNAAVDPKEFQFVPPDNVYAADVTPQYVDRIRNAAAEGGGGN